MSAGASNSVHQLTQMKVRPTPALRSLTGWNYSSSGVAELHRELTLPSFSCRNPSSLGYFQLWLWCLLLDENGWVMKTSLKCAVGLAPLEEGQQPSGPRSMAWLCHNFQTSKMTSALCATKSDTAVLSGAFWSLLPNITCSVSVY